MDFDSTMRKLSYLKNVINACCGKSSDSLFIYNNSIQKRSISGKGIQAITVAEKMNEVKQALSFVCQQMDVFEIGSIEKEMCLPDARGIQKYAFEVINELEPTKEQAM